MKKVFKKAVTLLLALGVILAMGVTSFAETRTAETTITVKNVEAGATVTAYQVVQEKNGRWVAIANNSGNKITVKEDGNVDLKASDVTALANDTSGLTGRTMTLSGSDYTLSDVKPGMYLVLVTKTDSAKVYNPMIVSADYTTGENEKPEVDATSNFVASDKSVAYAKSSEPTIDKSVTSGKGKTANGETTNGHSVAVGDTVQFKIEGTFPSYSDNYDNNTLKYEIEDTLSEGFDAPKDFTVTVGGTPVKAEDKTYSMTGTNPFTISFKAPFIKEHGNENVVVTYSAKVNSNAAVNFDPNTNTAKLTYSNNPSTGGAAKPKESKTYNYTFGIDANLNGESTTNNKRTSEIIKTDEDGKVEKIDSTETTQESTKVTEPLKDAEFTLYKSDGKTVVKTAMTGSDGYLSITGLNEGEYVLKETKAPTGYALDDESHSVKISAKYNEDGTLASYTVTIDGNATSTYTATYDKGTITKISGDSSTVTIKNIKTKGLPSTGGMGTYLFIILGIAIIALAGGLLIRRRRNENRQE